MTSLALSNESDSLDLNSVLMLGYGVQAKDGITGFGLPPVSAQFVDGAGDGSQYRNSRTLVRDIDLPLDIKGRTPAELSELVSRLARILEDKATLTVTDRVGEQWAMTVVRVGGGDYALSSGLNYIEMVVTLRAADPYWTAVESQQIEVSSEPVGSLPFLDNLIQMPLLGSQAFGSVSVNNTGDVPAYPIWTVLGPGSDFKATSPTGEEIHWTGTLLAGESLIVDTSKGTAVDGTGANVYADLAAAPKFWKLPPGESTVSAELLDADEDSKIYVSWAPRRWMVI